MGTTEAEWNAGTRWVRQHNDSSLDGMVVRGEIGKGGGGWKGLGDVNEGEINGKEGRQEEN